MRRTIQNFTALLALEPNSPSTPTSVSKSISQKRTALRISQVLFSLSSIGLLAYVSEWFSQFHHTTAPFQVSFLLLATLLSLLLCSLFLVANTVPALKWARSPTVECIADGVLAALWILGSLALTEFLVARVCTGLVCLAAYSAGLVGGVQGAQFGGSMALGLLQIWGEVCEDDEGVDGQEWLVKERIMEEAWTLDEKSALEME